jgi:hypothetical protein
VPVRSTVLAVANHSGTGLPAAIGTVPPGHTWLVKSAYVRQLSGVQNDVDLYIDDSAGHLAVFFTGNIGSNVPTWWNGWVAAREGSRIVLNATGPGPIEVWVSGADLPGIAPFAPTHLPLPV